MTTSTIDRPRIERIGKMIAEHHRRMARKAQSGPGGLMEFIRYYWHMLEPENELIEGWALSAICQHLEAITSGEITRLLMTVPPGFMKSLCTDVFWPAWMWGPMNMAHKRIVAFSYSASLTERDNERFRDLIIHPSYQELWGDRVRPIKIGATKITNAQKGWKLASSVGGVGTGERGDLVVLDDAHNIKEAESDVVRMDTVRWFRESMSDRLNSMENGAIVVIMQRAHEDDVAGAILSMGLPYCHLMIPMEYSWDRQTDEDGNPRLTDIGWYDPRYIQGEPDRCEGALAWEERFPAEVVEQIKHVKGPYAYAGQYMQTPEVRGGGIFRRDWWQLWEPPDGKYPLFEYVLASLDTSYTTKESNDPNGMTVWGVFLNERSQRRIMLINAWRKHLRFHGMKVEKRPDETVQVYRQRSMPHWGLVEWAADTCRTYKVDRLLVEAKASGLDVVSELSRLHGREGWAIQPQPVKGDKESRAHAVVSTFSQGMVYAPNRDWAEMVIDEMAVFPVGKYKDLTDSATQAIKHLRAIGLAQTDEEAVAEEMDRVRHRPRLRPLYPTA